ncbi:MAG: dephospho-CoA kinase [Gammaproteobacteria bacterium]
MIVGLTGGIASGKSTVAELFAERGVPVLDTDLIARDVVAPGTPGLARLVSAFGDDILNPEGALDRASLRARVFADDESRQRLEAITHPLIRQELLQRSALAGGPYQIHVIPLLVESGLQQQVDRVLVVDCPVPLQMERLLARDGETPEGAKRMIAAQASRQERLQLADDIINNDSDRASLIAAVNRLDQHYRQLAGSGGWQARGPRLR